MIRSCWTESSILVPVGAGPVKFTTLCPVRDILVNCTFLISNFFNLPFYKGILENVPSSNNYQGGFGSSLMAKDLGLAQNSATRTSSAIPLGSLAHQLYRLMSVRGYANKDFSSIYQFLQEMENNWAFYLLTNSWCQIDAKYSLLLHAIGLVFS